MSPEQIAHRAARLIWLAPSASRLVALADLEEPALADDPASVLLLLRFSRPAPTLRDVNLAAAAFKQSAILEAAAAFTADAADAWLDPNRPVARRLLRLARDLASEAESLARASGLCQPTAARTVGLVLPLGWLALAAVAPDQVEACWSDPQFSSNPLAVQRSYLGNSAEAVARRLARRWRLPALLANTISTLRLPVVEAVRMGADPDLTRIVRHAIAQSNAGQLFGMADGPQEIKCCDHQSCHHIEHDAGSDEVEESPFCHPLLPALLRQAARARRSTADERIEQIESENDALREALCQKQRDFESQLRDAKLQALAELAAGAGHEINNPLAVISGHAQLLKTREEDPDRLRSLEVIIRQTGRIADLLHHLMQFARPTLPVYAWCELNRVLVQVEQETRPYASLKGVRLHMEQLPQTTAIYADASQIRAAISELVRNAIEATEPGGKVLVTARQSEGKHQIVVEDDGPGPSAEQLPHLFDPFFSGRNAGRGRGLGLCTAWRYAQLNRADIRFERGPKSTTRFIMEINTAGHDTQSWRHTA